MRIDRRRGGRCARFGTPPQALAYVGHPIEPMRLVPIQLVARAKTAPTETWIRLSLIVPLD